MMREDQAYLLKITPHRDHVDHATLFTKDHGRMHVFLPKRLRMTLLQAYAIQWESRRPNRLIQREPIERHCPQGEALLSMYYLLEWLLHFSHEGLAMPQLFHAFQESARILALIQSRTELEITLRCFERQALNHLGYGLDVTHIEHLKAPYISYDPHQGYQAHFQQSSHILMLPRQDLYEILADHYPSQERRKQAKRWFQSIVASILPNHQWKSRSLFAHIS